MIIGGKIMLGVAKFAGKVAVAVVLDQAVNYALDKYKSKDGEEATSIKNCASCDTVNINIAKFCANCGTKL